MNLPLVISHAFPSTHNLHDPHAFVIGCWIDETLLDVQYITESNQSIFKISGADQASKGSLLSYHWELPGAALDRQFQTEAVFPGGVADHSV